MLFSPCCFIYFQGEILQLSEKYVKTLAKETENTIDGPYSGRLTGYGKLAWGPEWAEEKTKEIFRY